MSVSILRELTLVYKDKSEDLGFGQAVGRKRDLRWKTFRQSVSEDKSIAFLSKPDISRLGNDFLDLIEEKCGDDQFNLQESCADTRLVSNQLFQYTSLASQGNEIVLAGCKNDAKHRLYFVADHVGHDTTLSRVLADINIGHVHGFGSEAFSPEELRQIPDTLTFTEQTNLNTAQTRVYCPYLFFNQANSSARHDIEWALNRCALDGSSILRALQTLHQALRSDEGLTLSRSNITLFSCAVSHNWIVLNHHWISGDKLCMAPLCKFDLRDSRHKSKFRAWTEAIGRWAEVQLLPLFRQTLKTLSEWDEVLNDPLNLTPASEFDRFVSQGSSESPRKRMHTRYHSDVVPTKDMTAMLDAIPATSIGLHFPASTHESTQRILSWQREMTVWQNMPRSAGLPPKISLNYGSSPRSHRMPEERVHHPDAPNESCTRSSNSKSVKLHTKVVESRDQSQMALQVTCSPAQRRLQHKPRQRDVRGSLSMDSSETSFTTNLGVGQTLRYSQSSQDTKSSLPLRSPLFQHHVAHQEDCTTPLSSVGTRFEDGTIPKIPVHDDGTLSHSLDISVEETLEIAPNNISSKYTSIEEWAQQQSGLVTKASRAENLESLESLVPEVVYKHEVDAEKLDLGVDTLLQPVTVSPIGNDRASMTLWIDHVLGEMMICIE